MPRNGSGVYSADWVNASPNTTIESAKQNAMVADLVTDANAARPITAGGTARTTARLLDGTWRFENTADPTKLLAFDLSGLTTATTRTVTLPDKSGTALFTNDNASQAEQETATSAVKFVTPAVQQSHPSAAKAWGRATVSGGVPTLQASYNVTAINDDGVGIISFTIATDFTSANWTPVALILRTAEGTFCAAAGIAAGSVQLIAQVGVTYTDPAEWYFAGFGDQ